MVVEAAALRKDHRRRTVEAVEEAEAEAECTGGSCGSFAAVAVADCVAVCCCPFAVVDILALALLKLPYAAARKLYALGRDRVVVVRGGKKARGGGASEKVVRVEKGDHAPSMSSSEQLISCSGEASMDDVLLVELCEVARLGFGRVSFTGAN